MGKHRAKNAANRAAALTATSATANATKKPGDWTPKDRWHVVAYFVPAMAVVIAVVAVQDFWLGGYQMPVLDSPIRPASGPPCNFYLAQNSVPLTDVSPNEPFALSAVERAQPVVLRSSTVTRWKAQNWTLDHLAKKIVGPLRNVYENNNRWFGPYFDSRKPLLPHAKHPNPYRTNLSLPTQKFMARLTVNHSGELAASGRKWIYYSGPLEELGKWTDSDVTPLNELLLPNPSVSSVNVWMGPPHVVAHCHYDGYHNFYAQLIGRKRFWLAPPTAWPELQSAPFLHPMHAQCQVNLSIPASETVCSEDEVDNVELLEVILQPGDLLYIPPLWFHHVESVDVSVSVNVWTDSDQSEVALKMFEQPVPGQDHLPSLNSQQRAVMATVAAQSLLSAVCRLGYCTVSADKATTAAESNVHRFLQTLRSARYQPMIDSGLLRLPESAWESPLCHGSGLSGLQLDLSALLGSAFDRFRGELEQLSGSVSHAAGGLPAETRTIWLGNYVEFLAAQYVEAEHVGHWLHDVVKCL